MAWKDPRKSALNKAKKIIKKIPVIGGAVDLADELFGGAVSDAAEALGLAKSEADKRKDRTREFHEALRKGDWAHIEKTAQVEGALGGKGTRHKGLALEALWILAQRKKGYTLEEIRAAIAGNGGSEARGGRLPNLDGTPNYTAEQWLAQRGGAPAQAPEPSAPAPRQSPATSPSPGRSAPSAPRAPASSPSPSQAPRTPSPPRPLAECGPGRERNPETNRCRKIPAAPASSGDLGLGLTGAQQGQGGGCPPGKELNPATGRCRAVCKYGRDPATDRCRGAPPRTAAQKRQGTAQKRVEREVEKGITKGAQYIYKSFGPLGTLKLLAKGSLVAGAGLAAWALTKKIATLRPRTWADAHRQLADAYRAAKQELRDSRPDIDWSGGEETKRANIELFGPLNAWYQERSAILDQLEELKKFPTDYKGNPLGYVFDDDNPTYGDPFKN